MDAAEEAPERDSSFMLPAATPAATRATTTRGEAVRVRLMIALPVAIVTLLTVMGGVIYQAVMYHLDYSRDPRVQEMVSSITQAWLLVLIVFLVTGTLVGLYLAYTITRPMKDLISLARRVAAGDFSDTMNLTDRRDEVGELASSFNFMVESLNRFISTRNRFITESFSGGLLTVDDRGVVTLINSAAEHIFGLRSGDVVGEPVAEAFARTGLEPVAALVAAAWERPDGPCSGTVELETVEGYKRLRYNVSPMRDHEGKVFGLILNFRDFEKWRQFYDEMNRADRLATIGTFAMGLAHEIRNPLGGIKGMAQLLAEEPDASERTREFTQIMVKEVNRLDALVREVQEYAQPSAGTLADVDLNLLVRQTLELAQNSARAIAAKNVRVEAEYGELPTVSLVADKFQQALLNVVMNAYQATPEGGAISVRSFLSTSLSRPVTIEVRNTGSSIPADQLARVFEPFYTTKQGGTGLGLAITYQIVTHLGGDIRVESDDDSVLFRIELPLAAGAE